MTYTEIWNIAPYFSESLGYPVPLVFGLVFIIYESIVVISLEKYGQDSKIFNFLNAVTKPQFLRYPYTLIFFPIGIIAIFVAFQMNQNEMDRINSCMLEIHNSKIETVEGLVSLTRNKSSSKEQALILNKTFVINGSIKTFYFNETSLSGGCLTEGKRVKIHYIATTTSGKTAFGDGKIIKIESTNMNE